MQQRARKQEDKEARRQAILDTAWRQFLPGTYPGVTMAEVASALGLAKGTIYLYFPTKEELFLALVEEQLAQWFTVVNTALPEIPKGDVEAVAALIGGTLQQRHGLTRLLAILSTVLEQNVGLEAAIHFKTFLRLQLGTTGALLEARLPFLRRDQGAEVLLTIHALIVGLQHLAVPAPVVRELLAEPEWQMFAVDFDRTLARTVSTYLYGLAILAGVERSTLP